MSTEPKTTKEICDEWNSRNPIGAVVIAEVETGQTILTTTSSEAAVQHYGDVPIISTTHAGILPLAKVKRI